MEPLAASDKQALFSALGRVGLADQQLLQENLWLFHARELVRGEYLLRGGESATLAGVLVTGLLREHFVTERGVERTKSFILPLQFTGQGVWLDLGYHATRAGARWAFADARRRVERTAHRRQGVGLPYDSPGF